VAKVHSCLQERFHGNSSHGLSSLRCFFVHPLQSVQGPALLGGSSELAKRGRRASSQALAHPARSEGVHDSATEREV